MTESRNSEQGRTRIALAIARCDAIAALRRNGVSIDQASRTEIVVRAVRKTGLARRESESDINYLRRFSRLPTVREVAPPRTPSIFRPLSIHPHLRQSEIDAQPHYIGLGGQ